MIETAQRRGIAFSMDEATLERFGVADGAAFLARIAESIAPLLARDRDFRDYKESRARWRLRAISEHIAHGIEVADHTALSAFVSDDHIALEDRELTADMKVLLAAITRGYGRLIDRLNVSGYEDRTFSRRHIRLGRSETALAWTDGRETIWIDIEHARLLRRGYSGAFRIATTLLHEMLHDGPDTGTHQHDFAFYQ